MATPARVVILPKNTSTLRVEEISIPDPGPHQVLVRQHASGICHSQLHEMHAPNRPGPVSLGHESTGIVLKVGPEVTHVEEGDTVFVTWVPRNAEGTARPAWRASIECSEGLAQSGFVFTWADHTLADEQYVVKVDPSVRMDVTAIIGCAVMTGAGAVMNTANVQAGQSVAIFGVGGVGLSAVVAARMAGADPIIAVDLDDEKLAFARKFGATETVNASDQDPIAAIRALTGGKPGYTLYGTPVAGADFTFDCIGIKKTMQQIVPACRDGHFGSHDGGTAVLVGVPLEFPEIDARDLLLNEKHFIGSIGGSCSPDRDFATFIDWFEKGELDLDALVTERYSIDQINEATAALEAGEISGRAILEFEH